MGYKIIYNGILFGRDILVLFDGYYKRCIHCIKEMSKLIYIYIFDARWSAL
jgi:hypothetical protein